MFKSKLPLKDIFTSDLFLPILLLVVYVLFLIVARGVIPTGDELVATFSDLYSKYGYEIIGLASFLEALILVNFFIPGQVAMALGVIFSRTGETSLPLVVIVVVTGSFCGYVLDYILGYFGFSDILKKLGYGEFLKEAKVKLRKFGNRSLVLGFIHSNVAAFLSLIAGTIRMNFIVFVGIAFISTLFWASVWSILVYTFGDIFLIIIKRYTFLIVLIVLSGFLLTRIWKNSK